ncbi:MAG: GDP-mannose 4,6-dehydratase [Bacteriovoracia bacterium]
MKKKAVIVGVGGQDGSYLSELLVSKGYQIVGIRKGELDLAKADSVIRFVADHMPDEVYYLAAHHHSSEQSKDLVNKEMSRVVNLMGPTHFLAGIRLHTPATRFFYASSSHIFAPSDRPLNELSKRAPENLYAQMKIAAMEVCEEYRKVHGIFASVGILFNHESPRRPPHFLTQKVATAAHEISLGKRSELILGDLEAKVDWGYAPDFVRGMWLGLQHSVSMDYVLATGKIHSVKDLVERVFKLFDLDWQKYVKASHYPSGLLNFSRCGDYSKANQILGWQPLTEFNDLLHLLVVSKKCGGETSI